MDTNKKNMLDKLKKAFANPESNLSISSTQNEEKIEIKNNKASELNAKKILKAAWGVLAITGVSATLLTVPDFVQRADTLTRLLNAGKVDTHGQMIDNVFYKEHGVNLKDSLKAGIDKLSHGFMKNDEINAAFEKGLTAKPLQFLTKADLIQKVEDIPSLNENENTKKSSLK